MANELIVTNAAALAALVDKTTGDSLTAAEWTTAKDSLQEANTATRSAGSVFAGPTTGAAAAPTFRALTVTDMEALRTFVRPVTEASNLGGGFYSCAMFQFTLGDPDAVAAQLIATVKIVEATDSGSFYFEAPVCVYQDPANGMSGSIPAGLIRSQYVGSPGTGCSLTAAQLNFLAPSATTALLVAISGFVAPSVFISARLQCPGDAIITLQ